ncbi:MAG: GNAT family N-acetyltransferase [Oscillospiraceae bacterium]|nr:GNAT family N-acetyltransferase [Oscillospiraceae bacterium]
MKVYKTLPDGTQIVEYEDSLAEAVADMWNRSGEGWGGSFDNGVYTAERVRAKRAGGMFFNVYIAMKDGEALGYCSFNRYYKDADTAYVHLLNVRPDYHGKGLGKELVLMCVNETIARGMPRLDIHTWPGNTKAVPMYKKCGYFWEDRTDTTHLSNFIPTVLGSEATKDFFETADWYADSTRKIDINPDGKKVNKFELYEYQWEKDGKHLRVGFEKTGRRINLIETDDYKIELTAMHHELAYGLSYPCSFHVKNKTGKELNVCINAKDNDVIKFEGSWDCSVEDEAVFDGSFFVGAITEEQDDMRMHPCVLADVYINGKHAEFGLGIEPKFPVAISLGRKLQPLKQGMSEKIYINIKNGLSSGAVIKFSLPQNTLLQFEKRDFKVKLADGKDASVSVSATVTGCGYSGDPMTCEITMDNGEAVSITRPLHIVNQGINEQFEFEHEDYYAAANGLWRLALNKQNNDFWFDRIVSSGFVCFQVSKLGMPYDDEFNIAKPSDIRVTNEGSFTRFEADYTSEKFIGAVLTEIYLFDSAGTIKRSHRVKNIGKSALELSLMTQFWSNVGRRAIFPYDGGVHEVADKMNFGFDTLDKEKIDENWVFDASGGAPSGIYWPPQYKPDINWGDLIKFEVKPGTLIPGQSYETESVVYMCDVFKDFKDFRNYVLGIFEEKTPFKHNHLEILANGGNPVVSADMMELTVRNNRLNIRGGTVTVSSPDDIFTKETQTNPNDELKAENVFSVPVRREPSGIGTADFSLFLSGFEAKYSRTLLMQDNTLISTAEKDSVFTVENGSLRFEASPGFSEALYSLKLKGNEWMFSNYPSTEPYAWWNPFIGGLYTHLNKMNNNLILREKITAAFVTETDSLGNVWSGIRTDIFIENFDMYKGMYYSLFYMTLPGVPVMCHYARLNNNTGRYLDDELHCMLIFSGEESLSEICVEMTDGDIKCKVHPGTGEEELLYDKLLKVSRNKDNPRSEKLYIYKDSGQYNGKHQFDFDNKIACSYFNTKYKLPNGGQFTSLPIFCILTDKDLSLESLDDLRRISF